MSSDSERFSLPSTSGSMQDEQCQRLEPLLDYGCSYWKTSSQRASEFYDLGIQLWGKEDLIEIEQQLAQSRTLEKFTVRCIGGIGGNIVHIKNPMFGEAIVKFQEFWHLVQTIPDGPPETYRCPYLVDWKNQTVRNYEGPIEKARLLFETSQKQWDTSTTCEAFTSQFRKLLDGDGNAKKVTKVVCFGLGDMNFKPPDWWRIASNSKPEVEQEPETSVIEGALIHHAIALTIANIIRSYAKAGDMRLRVLAQDPGYSEETKDMLQEIGFEVVGEYGAGGFAEVDGESAVFSAFAAVPFKQIIADLARPAIIICARSTSAGVFSYLRKPYADPESPRTKQMWKEYKSWDFPVLSESVQLAGSLHQLVIHSRIRDGFGHAY